jgi:hypothetical protein
LAVTEEGAKGRSAKRGAALQAMTANRLVDGIVVFLAEDGSWSERAQDCRIARTADEAAALTAVAEAAATAGVVVGPYLMEVVVTPQGAVPAKLRERIRALGPSVRVDVGKQAEKDLTNVPV